jgi:hypothetical protein
MVVQESAFGLHVSGSWRGKIMGWELYLYECVH